MLRPDDTIQIYTSPYRRTRETTEGILSSLAANDSENGPSPFPRRSVRVWEEPRLREQDFGNFQPGAADMERMWRERAEYGHFFYRIPNGESAADAYDRVSGFNETLWRSFGEDDFGSVCVLVTHGLMTRVFLMKWYHWSVEYFEDLRNVDHCEFVVMERDRESDKFVLRNELRTWSELKRRKALEVQTQGEQHGAKDKALSSPPPTRKRWDGCPEGCTRKGHDHSKPSMPPQLDHPSPTSDAGPQERSPGPSAWAGGKAYSGKSALLKLPSRPALRERPSAEEDEEAFPHFLHQNKKSFPSDYSTFAHWRGPSEVSDAQQLRPNWLEAGRDFGGSRSGIGTPEAGVERAEYGFPHTLPKRSALQKSTDGGSSEAGQPGEEGMGSGARADALGDQGSGEEVKELEEEEKWDKGLRGSVF